MSTGDDKPTQAERYVRAATSTHLRLQSGQCDVDQLIAAGWLKQDALGTQLYRLLAEFDSVRSSMRAAERNRPQWENLIKASELAIKNAGSPVARRILEEPARLRRELQSAMVCERYDVLAKLKTLAPAREGLFRFARELAGELKFAGDAAVGRLMGRALDAWLDPICDGCQGRGFNGGSHRGEPAITCRACRGTKLRRDSIGMNGDERRFVQALLAHVDRMLADVDHRMRAFLDQRDRPARQAGSASTAGLQQRLQDLRSAEAEHD